MTSVNPVPSTHTPTEFTDKPIVMLGIILERNGGPAAEPGRHLTQASARWKVAAVVMLACILPALVSVAAYVLFGSARHAEELLHVCLEVTGGWIALAAVILIWLRVRHEETCPHMLYVAAALVGMGLVDGAHAIAPFGTAWSWLGHGATLMGGLLFALVWLPPPANVLRRKRSVILVTAVLAVASSLAVWLYPESVPAPWGPTGYSLASKVANGLGGLGFLAAAWFFVRRHLRRPAAEDLGIASYTALFATSGLLFGYSHVWAADWWVWHGFRLLAYGMVLGSAYEALGFAMARDITARKQAEAAGQESDADFGMLADGVPQMVWICTPDGLNVYFNQRWVDYTGLTLEESYGGGWNTPFHPDDKQAAWDAWRHATETGENYRIESRLRAADGTYRWFLMHGVPVRDAAGNILKWFGTCTDIHDLKQAEEALRNVNEELRQASAYNRSLIEGSLDPLVTIGPDGRITDVNKATEGITGLSRQGLIGTDFSDYFTDPEKERAVYQHVFKEGWTQDYELEIRHRDGTTRPVLYNASLYRNEAGATAGIFAAARDITARKRVELKLQELNATLECRVAERTADLVAANQELESFNYSVSHDLRSPLRHIDGFSKILLDGYGAGAPEDARLCMQRVRDGARRMGRMVDELLELSRTSRREVSKQVTGLGSLVHDVLEELRPELQDREIEWRIGELPFADCDPTLTRQVFANLLSNAVKFTQTRKPAVIELGQTRLDGETVLFVRDNGVGFSMKYANKLFGVFQRLHRREDFEGTGVGLVTVQRIIQKHGGRIWAEAELEKGATFYFTLEQPGRRQPLEPAVEPIAVL